MIIQIICTVVGKVSTTWTSEDGKSHINYELNIIQKDGQIISKLRVSEEIYASIERNKIYTFEGFYGTGKNGGYLKITNILNNEVK